MIKTKNLVKELNNFLNIYDYQDYGPNGLQIQGKDEIKKLAFAVSATKASVAKAVELKADALIVHHGLFWKFHGPKTLTGAFYHRVAPLVKNDINLLGYHLPLDANLEVGNAKAIADLLKLEEIAPFGDHKGMPTGIKGRFASALTPYELRKKLEKILGHSIIHASPNEDKIKSMGIITGGANGDWIMAKRAGLDSYLTGEISEHDWHEASEDNIHFYAGGHNATEQFGIQSLMKFLENKYTDCEYVFIESNNPA